MKVPFVRSLLVAALATSAAHAGPAAQRAGFSHVYPTSYEGWQSAFLGGNGKRGIMVFGNPLDEVVVFNDRGFNLSRGGSRTFATVRKADLDKIRKLCAAGDFKAANELAAEVHQWKDGGDGSRHPGYAMFLTIPPAGEIRDFERKVDFRTGVISVRWTDDRGEWSREAFVSRKDDVVVQRLVAPSKGKINCTIRLGTDPDMGLPSDMAFSQNSSDDFLNIRAKYKPELTAGYEGVTRYIVNGGSHAVKDDVLEITNADSVLLLTRTEKYREDCEARWTREDLQKQLSAIPADYAKLLERQVQTHGEIYDRVALDLGASEAERAKTNEELLAEQKASAEPNLALWERLFDAGRYHYLSASSALTPPDLLGIWSGDARAGWSGFYHLDANLNLQISGGNIGAMPEAMEGYFALNEAWKEDFQTNARKLLGTRGMLAGGNTPGPQSGLISSLNFDYPYQYVTGEQPWLLYPFWEHYLITGDKEFLRNRLYPLLKEAVLVYEDFLTETDQNGKYIFAGSISPENQPSNVGLSLVNNSTFDIAGAKFALRALLETCRILGVEQGPGGGVERWSAMLKKLPPYLVNQDGALQEWSWPGLEESYGHRHWSQCITVFPYREITPEDTPELFKAASVTLAKKSAHYTGPGHGVLHGALVAAGLKNPEVVRNGILQFIHDDYYFNSLATSHNPEFGIFCTDVAHTVPTILMEMTVSSAPGVIELLPAIPEGLEKGSLRGVKGRNRVTVEDVSWDLRAKVVQCVLKSDIDQDITLIERDGIRAIQTEAPVRPSPIGEIARVVSLEAGKSTPIALQLGNLRPRYENHAKSRPVSASSQDGEYPPEAAVDDELATRWASESKDDQWLQVDLETRRRIAGIRINWEKAAGKDYDIEVSDDGQSWKVVGSVKGNAAEGWAEFPDLDTQGRYVRIVGRTRATEWGFSIKELQVLGEK